MLDLNNKGDQYEDPVTENVYASPREPEPEIIKTEEGMQTEQEKNINSDIAMGCDRMREQVRDSVTEALRLKREEMAQQLPKKKKKAFRGGKRSYYKQPIDEEESVSQASDR